MRIKRGILKQLVRITKFSPSYLSDLIATRKRPSWKRSEYLESISGISKILWISGTSSEIKTELNEKFALYGDNTPKR